jgi:hypothetical protein
LKGIRGEKLPDLKLIVDNLQRLSQYIPDFPQIKGKGELTEDIHVGLLKRNGQTLINWV